MIYDKEGEVLLAVFKNLLLIIISDIGKVWQIQWKYFYMFMVKSKLILVVVLYRPPDKKDFVKNLEETFTGVTA